MSRTCRGHLWE